MQNENYFVGNKDNTNEIAKLTVKIGWKLEK